MRSSIRIGILLLVVFVAVAPGAIAQDGSIDFTASATPTGGLQEPVRGFPFFLLDRSYQEIDKEVAAMYPKPDMNTFIDKLEVSKELKAWMKKHHWVTLSGEDFIHKLKVDDIMNVPEFYMAYMDRNAGDQSVDFPKPKFKPSDKVKHPEKYEKLSTQYTDAVRHYIQQNPESIDGIDLNLTDVDPSPQWRDLMARRLPLIHHQVMELAQSKYYVARTVTNLQGQGVLNQIPPGTYWLSTLDVAADVGDARPRWDVRVMVRPGAVSTLALTNVNAIQPPAPHATP